MVAISNVLLASGLGLATLSSAARNSTSTRNDQNWELFTNSLGYSAVRFKPGMEPGSADYARRFKRDITPVNATFSRRQDENRRTEPFAGEARIAYGCETDIAATILSKLADVCDETRCDEGQTVETDVKFPRDGREEDATVSFTVDGAYPSGMRDALIEALQAEVIAEAVEVEEVLSSRPALGFDIARAFACDVSHSSNFLSVVVRNADDDGLIGDMNVQLSFDDGSGEICGTIANAAGAIVGAINGIAGGVFGVVQEIACAAQ